MGLRPRGALAAQLHQADCTSPGSTFPDGVRPEACGEAAADATPAELFSGGALAHPPARPITSRTPTTRPRIIEQPRFPEILRIDWRTVVGPGRGLAIIAAHAEDNGIRPSADGVGKIVWAPMPTGGNAPVR